MLALLPRSPRSLAARISAGFALAAALALASPSVSACLWDRDTLMQERSRFPTALELLTGKFLRHSREFYAWRVADRRARLAVDPDDLALVDDLAVALDKLGEHREAITTMEAVLPRAPRRYETLANLGTFYLHSGDFPRGLEFLDRALEVNPDAHFGRERYQRWLAEYLLELSGADGSLDLPLFSRGPGGFENFLAEKLGTPQLSTAESQAAVLGVLGMMRFGQHDSPILCEVLGDLLYAPSYHDAKQLAARAYLSAARRAGSPATRAAYEAQAKAVLHGQAPISGSAEQVSFAAIKASLAREQAEADAWAQALFAEEATWIRESPDPEAELQRRYADEPRITGEAPQPAGGSFSVLAWAALAAALVALGLVVLGRRVNRQPEV